MRIGCHVSIRHGYFTAAKFAKSIGAKSFQFFPKNPRSLQVKNFDEKDAHRCANYCQEEDLVGIAHAPYPVNLSQEDIALRKITRQSLINDLDIVEACGAAGLVVHFGKYKGKDPLEGYKLMIDMLNGVLQDWKGKALLLIENNAGQGGRMGITLEELVQVRELSDYSERIGFCLDTCHAFASELWSGDDWDELVEKGTALGYFSHLKAIHLNDSVYGFGSYRDRHANIGRGFIGEAAFRGLLRSGALQGLPVILETPENAEYNHATEIAYVSMLKDR